MNFISYEVATDEDGMHFVSAFDYNDPDRQFAHFDRFNVFEYALARCNDISEEDEFAGVEELEASEDWEEIVFDENRYFEDPQDRTPDIYELLVG